MPYSYQQLKWPTFWFLKCKFHASQRYYSSSSTFYLCNLMRGERNSILWLYHLLLANLPYLVGLGYVIGTVGKIVQRATRWYEFRFQKIAITHRKIVPKWQKNHSVSHLLHLDSHPFSTIRMTQPPPRAPDHTGNPFCNSPSSDEPPTLPTHLPNLLPFGLMRCHYSPPPPASGGTLPTQKVFPCASKANLRFPLCLLCC